MERLHDHLARFEAWLAGAALPLWRDGGFRLDAGFVERIDQSGRATADAVRSRVNPRQVYCFAEAGRRGWPGDWRTAAEAGLQRFKAVYRRDDGLYGNLATLDGALIDPSFDLYNQAFALLAFAAVAAALPTRRDEMETRAGALLAVLRSRYAHQQAGFEETSPPTAPLASNPHMHLFEAAQAWAEIEGADAGPWIALADEIDGLCRARFIDRDSGVLREFFARDWSPFAGDRGRIVEPGHQFEWAWLLARWARRRGNADGYAAARRLFAIGETHGVDPERGVAIMTLGDDLSVVNPVARLWPQTEWLKSAMLLATVSEGAERAAYLASAERACAALAAFIDTPLPGLWWDRQTEDGRFLDEPAPASTFYHIICAIGELRDRLDELARENADV